MHKTTMPTSLLDIPEEVIRKNVLPLLRVNELLRLRHVCWRTKGISEDYLERHPCSRKTIFLVAKSDSESKSGGQICVGSFLEKELELKAGASKVGFDDALKIPSFRFKLFISSKCEYPLFSSSNFISGYENQIKHLEIPRMFLPFTTHELEFYEKLPNLKHLAMFDIRAAGTEKSEIMLPRVFTNLRSLKIHHLVGDKNSIWKLIESCKNLRRLGIGIEEPDHFCRLKQIISLNYFRKLEFLDMENVVDIWRENYTSDLHELWEVLATSNLKLTNVNFWLFHQIERRCLRKAIAPKIISLKNISLDSLEHGEYSRFETFPKVESLQVYIMPVDEVDLDQEYAMVKRQLSPLIFPALRELKLSIFICDGSHVLTQLWSCLNSLEEISFVEASLEFLTDLAFIGKNDERPFLQLTKLKKIALGELNTGAKSVQLTNASFIQVFRHLKLREFLISTEKPFTHVTTEGILALLDGPFRETVEYFPFHGWSLPDTSQQEFLLLARQFPCNKEF